MHQSLSTLTNEQVARLILRQLWQSHDAGGVSMGRGFRSVLLESAIGIMPMPDMYNPDFFRPQRLFEEAAGRKAPIPSRVRPVFSLKRASKRTLAILLLHELRMWYREDAEKDPLRALTSEARMVDVALQLLPLPQGFKRPSSWSTERLIGGAQERYRAQLRRELEQRMRGAR